MSDAEEGTRIGLESVAKPAVPPPTVPDEWTREEHELLKLKEMASKPALRNVFLSERENARLTKELEEANQERRDLQGRVFQLGPENARLNQTMSDLKGNFSIAAPLLTLGGISISIAGTLPDGSLKSITRIAGITGAVIGGILTFYTLFWVKPHPST